MGPQNVRQTTRAFPSQTASFRVLRIAAAFHIGAMVKVVALGVAVAPWHSVPIPRCECGCHETIKTITSETIVFCVMKLHRNLWTTPQARGARALRPSPEKIAG